MNPGDSVGDLLADFFTLPGPLQLMMCLVFVLGVGFILYKLWPMITYKK